MKRLNTMQTYLKPVAAVVVMLLVAGPAAAVDYYLAAKAFTKTLPDLSTVPMWGYVEDPDLLGDIDGDGLVEGDCYETTPADDRVACVNGLDDPVLTEPQLTVPSDQTSLRIFLTNALPEPTSIVIQGQEMPYSATDNGPTWDDGTTGARTNADQRVRSFGRETTESGGRRAYVWVDLRGNPFSSPGTFIYHSGTHPQKQVYMGLYGAATKDAVAEDIATGTSAEAYPGVPYDNEVVLFYSDIDPVLNKSIACLYDVDGILDDGAVCGTDVANYTTSILHHPTWFLVNGEPYEAGVTADIPAGQASDPAAGNTRSDTLIRFLSAAGETHVPVLQGLRMTIHAEDGIQYTWQNGGTVADTAPRTQYSAMLPPLKTKDAIISPINEGLYAVYDGNGYMTNPSDIDDFAVGDTVGGMLRFLSVGAANLEPVAVDDVATTDVNTPVLIDVVANDSDPEGDGLTIVSVTDPANGTAVITDDTCCVTYTPDPDVSGEDQFDYTITDGNGVTSTATALVTVTVVSVNQPPEITSTPVTTATTGVLYTYDVEATDVNGDVLTYSLTLGPVGMSIDGSTGLIQWTPTVQQNLPSYDVTVVVSDGLAIATQTYTIDVTLVNNPPTITSTPLTTATAGQAYSYDVDATDPDLDDTQTYSLDATSIDRGMTIDAVTGVIDWTPTMAQLGDNAVTVTVTDFNGLTDSQAYTLTVSANTAAGALFFSTWQDVTVPGVPDPSNNADIYAYDGVVFSRIVDTGFIGNMDALHMVDVDTFYVSFANDTGVTNGGVTLQDEDIGLYDAGTWSVAFDGSTVCGGLQGDDGLDIDAFDIVGGVLYFTTAGNTALPPASGVGPGLGQAWDNSDIYRWDGTTCSRIFDRDQSGVGGSNVDGLTIVDDVTFYVSFVNTTVSVPGIGSVQDEDVVLNNNGVWSVHFDGTAQGLTLGGHDLDAVHVP